MTEKRFKSRCYEKQTNVVIYDKGDKLFDVSYRDFEDAYYLKMKLIPVIDKLNELSEENKELKKEVNEWTQKYVNEMESHACTYRELDSIKQTLDDWKLDFDNVKETVRNGQGRVICIYYYI